MSAAALFSKVPGQGDTFVPQTIRLMDAVRGLKLPCLLVYNAIIDELRRGKTEVGEWCTDRKLQANRWLKGYSRRFIQSGLKMLEDLEVIRRRRRHGRRTIIVLRRLRAGNRREPRPKDPPEPRPRASPRAGKAPRPTPEQPTDPETLLLQLKALGWSFWVDDQGVVQKGLETTRGHLQWDELPADLLVLVNAHKPEIIAYVLANAAGAPGPRPTPERSGRLEPSAIVDPLAEVLSGIEDRRLRRLAELEAKARRTDAEEAERRQLAALVARQPDSPGPDATPARE